VGSPKISVVIPVYNCEDYVAEAVTSVLSQTFQGLELLLADDGSTDRSLDILTHFAQQNPGKVRVLTHPNHRHCGVSASRNLCIHQAAGEYVAFLDADDVWYPEKLERQLAVLEAYPHIGVVYCPLSVIDEHGHSTTAMHGTHTVATGTPGEIENAFKRFFSISMTMWAGSTALIRKDLLLKTSLFDKDMTHGEDAVLSIKLAYLAPIYLFPQPLAAYRIHSSNASWHFMTRGAQAQPHRNARIMNFMVMQRICTWLSAYSAEYNMPQFRIMLAHLCRKSYENHMISGWGFFRLLLQLLPCTHETLKMMKIFFSIFIGYRMTNLIQRMIHRGRHSVSR
jgi:glycosyltransferase involved in cell wall biosynthesis